MEKYNKTIWTNDAEPSISSERLNNIESGIEDITNEVIDIMTVSSLEGKDLNDIRDRGTYVARTSTIANTVENKPESTMKSGFLLEVFDNNGTAIIQRVTSFSPGSPDVFHRAFNSGNWGAWSKLPSDVEAEILKRPYILESKRISDGDSFTYYEKWSDGRLIVKGQIDMTSTVPANEMRVTVFDKNFPTPVPFVGLKTYCDTQPYIYDGTSSFGQFEIYFMRVSPLTNGGSLYIKKTSGGWTNNQRRMGIVWLQEGFWK